MYTQHTQHTPGMSPPMPIRVCAGRPLRYVLSMRDPVCVYMHNIIGVCILAQYKHNS